MSTYFDRAIADVQRELRTHGLSNLVYWVDLEIDYGLLRQHEALGWYCDHTITIPRYAVTVANRWSVLQKWLGIAGSPMQSLRDVLRHEYGHALRDLLGQFDRASSLWGVTPCISDYAAGQATRVDRADEDFAEVFMYYVKTSGKQRSMDLHPRLRDKWEAMRVAIERGGRRQVQAEVACPTCNVEVTAWTGTVSICPDCGSTIDLS